MRMTVTLTETLTTEGPRGPRRGRRPPTRRKRSRRDTLAGWAFVAPAFVVVVGLSLFPAAWAFLLSMQKWNGFSEPKFVGAANYVKLMTDEEFWQAVLQTGVYVLLFVPASVLAGLFLAVALNRNIRFIGLYRTAIFVPFVASAAATGILGTYVFNPQFGVANNVLRVTHLPEQGFLEDRHEALVIIAVMSLWQELGFTVVVYLAALQDIPQDLVEAARCDGASGWRVFRHIVLPELAAVTVFVTIWQTITAIQLFDLVYVTTRGGPLGSTETVVYYLWDQAFRGLRFGYGSAVASGLFAFTMVLTIGMVVYSRRAKFEAF